MKTIGFKLLLVLSSTWLNILLNAQNQPILIREYSYRSGLPARDAHFVTQTSSGLWLFGTNQGLYQFDGYDYHLYLNGFDVPKQFLYKPCKAAFFKGDLLYLALQDELLFINYNSKKLIKSIPIDGTICALFELNEKLFVITNFKGISLVNKNNYEVTHINYKDTFLFAQKQGNKIVTSTLNGTVYELNETGNLNILKLNNSNSRNYNYCLNDSGKFIGLLTHKLEIIYGDTNRYINPLLAKHHLVSNNFQLLNIPFLDIKNVFIDRDGLIWITTVQGVFTFHKKDFESQLLIQNVSTRGILVTSESNLEVSTYSGFYSGNYNSKFFTKTTNLPISWTLINHPTEPQKVIALTPGSGFVVYDNRTKTIDWLYGGINSGIHLQSAVIENENEITMFGNIIIRVDLKAKEIQKIHLNKNFDAIIYSAIKINKGQYLLGTKSGVYNVNLITGQFQLLESGECRWIVKTKEQNYMAAILGRGFFEYNYTTKQILPYKILQIEKQEDLFSFSGIFDAKSNAIYTGTNNGLFKINYSNGSIQLLNTHNHEFNTASLLLLGDTLLIAGGIDGLEKIFLKQQNSNPFGKSHHMFISFMRVHSHTHNIQEIYHFDKNVSLNFAPDVTEVELLFSSTNDIFEKSYLWRYRISGYHNNWISHSKKAGNRAELSFNRIKSGYYLLELQTQKGNGEWINSGTIKLYFRPYWYETWWFKIALIVGIGLSLWLMWNMNYYWKNKKQQTYERNKEMQLKIVQSELKALRNQINPHMFTNSLQTAQYYIYENEKDKAAEYLAQYSKLMRENLEISAHDFISISQEIDFLKSYCKLESLKRNSELFVDIRTENIASAHDVLIPSMIIQPFVENAFKHGLDGYSSNLDKLKIKFEMNHSAELLCTIYNTGHVLQNFDLNSSKISGNQITLSRLELYSEMLQKAGSIEYENTKNGLKATLHLPYKLKTDE